MVALVQQVMAGLAAGAPVGLSGLALWLGLAAGGPAELALAGVLGLAMLVGLVALGDGVPLLLALPLAGLCGAVLAVAAEGLAYRALRERRAPMEGAVLLAGLALWVGLERLAALLAGAWRPARAFDQLGALQWALPGGVPAAQAPGPLLLLLAVGLLGWGLARSWLGPALRAVAADPVDAVLGGVPVRRLRLHLAAIAGALAGLAGGLAGLAGAGVWLDPGLVGPLGRGLLVKGLLVALAVARLRGGVGWRAVLAVAGLGLGLGLVEAGCAAWQQDALRDVLAPGLLLAVALWPGRARDRRVGVA